MNHEGDQNVIASRSNPYSPPASAGSTNSPPRCLSDLLRLLPLACSSLCLAMVSCFLFALATAPYRPPHDMSSMLGSGEVELAFFLSAAFAFASLISASLVAKRLQRVFTGTQSPVGNFQSAPDNEN